MSKHSKAILASKDFPLFVYAFYGCEYPHGIVISAIEFVGHAMRILGPILRYCFKHALEKGDA